jgi:predicted metal-dependent hydrolase
VTDTLVIDGLTFELRRSNRRKTLGITVDRDGSLVLAAPTDCPIEFIEGAAREKLFWVHTKLARKRVLLPDTPEKEYVTGEGFYYLGRSYRLLLVDSDNRNTPALKLHRGRFMLRRDKRHHAYQHFVDWYASHGRPWIERRVALYAERVAVQPGLVKVRDLGYRWGSCAPGGNLNFNWRTICLPPRIVEYVVAHELVHMHEPHHGPEFWQRLQRAMPDHVARRSWLAENGHRF